MEKELKMDLPILTIGIVEKLTGLSARQIRYYERNGLIQVQRTEGKHRLFSLNDIFKLSQINEMLALEGNLAQVKRAMAALPDDSLKVDDEAARRLLHAEIMAASPFQSNHNFHRPI